MTFQQKYIYSHNPEGFHRLAYTEWGSEQAERTVVCVHGLSRNGRDFDRLAAVLAAEGFRVVCPDMPGRGASDWLANPELYGMPQYVADLTALIARLDVESVDWIGTSMGGLIGMVMAAGINTPIRNLILNDIGPFIRKAALQRIAGYVGSDSHFKDLEELEAYLRDVNAGFGLSTDADWRFLADISARPDPKGGLRLHYDPNIAVNFKALSEEDADLWPVWDKIAGPVLVVRGADSDILENDTVDEMLNRHADAERVEFTGIGHAPAFMDEHQIDAVRQWLLKKG